MEIKDILKNRRIELELTMKQVADAVGVSEGTVSKWESGFIGNMRRDKIPALAKVLHLDPRIIMGQDEKELEEELDNRPEFQPVPILGKVAAGHPSAMYEDITGWEQVDYTLAETGRLFALRIAGDSMSPEIKKGSVAIVRSQADADNGDVVIIQIDDEDATCKRVQKTNGGIMFVPSNAAYPPMFFSMKQIKEGKVHIIGKVLEIRTRY